MDTYIKTIINGLKSWVSSRLTRLETSVSGSLVDLANKLTSLTNKLTSLSNNVSKNTKDIAQLQTYEDETYSIATAARSTATAAQSTANAAQSTATAAQSTATAAQSTANAAQSTANAAQSTANRVMNNSGSWTVTRGLFYASFNAGVNGQTLVANVSPVCDNAYTSSGIYVWVASFQGSSKTEDVANVSMGGYTTTFGELVTVNQGDIIRIYKIESDDRWKAELTGINLDYEALDAAYTQGVNSL